MKHSWQVSFALLSIFLAAQIIGLLVVRSYVDVLATEKATAEAGKAVVVYQQLPYGVERPVVAPDLAFIFIGVAIFIGTLKIEPSVIKECKTLFPSPT